MNENTIKNYKEVNLDSNGCGADRSYRNPLARTFQYEYALYLAVADLFETVRCRSMCPDRLRLYFMELGHKKENTSTNGDQDTPDTTGNTAGNKNRNTREGLLEEMKAFVSRDVVGHIVFPMMHVCQAEVKILLEDDGTHSFVFTDGIYGFKVRLDIKGKEYPTKIEVTNLGQREQAHDRAEKAHAAVDSAA